MYMDKSAVIEQHPATHTSPKKTVKRSYDKPLDTIQCQYGETPTKHNQGSNRAEKGSIPGSLRSGLEQLSGYDLSDVRVHYNSAKPRALGALAYAQGTNIHLGPGQDKHLPHEAWHVVQQKQGRVKPTQQMKKGVNINNDSSLEREADVMGAKAMNAPNIGQRRNSPTAIAENKAGATLQCYTDKSVITQAPDDWNAGKALRISDNGNMAVAQDSSYGSHDMWALPSLITSANTALTAKKSVIRLKSGSKSLKGDAPDASGTKTLSNVVPENIANKTTGTNMTIWADCGRSGRDIMGAGRGTGKNYSNMTGGYTKERGAVGKFFGLSASRSTSASSPSAMASEIYRSLGGKAAYDALSDVEKEAFDSSAGINRHATPSVGEGYTMASGGANYVGKMTWNFHWAGVVMVSGGDSVTMENFATGDAEEVNKDWDFQMYGPATKADQTFHDQHKASQQHGMAPTTVKVRRK